MIILRHLSDLDMLHSDLKPPNFLIDSNGVLLLGKVSHNKRKKKTRKKTRKKERREKKERERRGKKERSEKVIEKQTN